VELVATAFARLLTVLLSVRTIGYKEEQRCGGESVSQPLLKDKVFSIFLDQNPPFEQRPENGVLPPTKACNAAFRDWWRRRLPSEGKGHTFESCRVRHNINYLAQARRCE
jgi:hypothetical protein